MALLHCAYCSYSYTLWFNLNPVDLDHFIHS